MVTFSPEMIFIKFVSISNFPLINPYNPLIGLKGQKNASSFPVLVLSAAPN